MRKRVSARGNTGADSAASAQVCPPSADTSTFVMVPRPDQAIPETSYRPGPCRVRPGDGRVMSDLTSIGKVNMSALPLACKSVYLEVSSLVMVGVGVTLSRRSHFTFMLPS